MHQHFVTVRITWIKNVSIRAQGVVAAIVTQAQWMGALLPPCADHTQRECSIIPLVWLWYSQHSFCWIVINCLRIQNKTSYLNTIEHLIDFGGIFHFEEGAQVSCRVVELYLEPFVSKSNLTAHNQCNCYNHNIVWKKNLMQLFCTLK